VPVLQILSGVFSAGITMMSRGFVNKSIQILENI